MPKAPRLRNSPRGYTRRKQGSPTARRRLPCFPLTHRLAPAKNAVALGELLRSTTVWSFRIKTLSVDQGAIRAFHGNVYSESLRDLQRAARDHGIRTHVPWSELNEDEIDFIMSGEPDYQDGYSQWYGVYRFFDWLDTKLYKMHVRVFLSKFRSYTTCPDCKGARLQPESLNWKWNGCHAAGTLSKKRP